MSIAFLIFNTAASGAYVEQIPDNIELNNVLLMELESGVVAIQMFPDKAPWHVYRIKLLVKENFYDGLWFHRVIDGFMAQTGDPTGTGTGGSKFGKMRAEINDMKHTRGAVSMARADDIDSANSQFFIVTGDYFQHLDGQYTIWGRVIHGMDLVDKLRPSTSDNNGLVKNPDKIVRMILGQDLNFNYEGDTDEQKEERRKERIEMLKNLKELKRINDRLNEEKNEVVPLLDRILELNGELE
ncbi:MAG: peptidylprolyl isomerase [Rickettsiales bacterium]|nr:peptidylprolyl isomerase [Rickettsiales bacterium]